MLLLLTRSSRRQTRSIRTRSPCRINLEAERTSSPASPETSRPSGSGPFLRHSAASCVCAVCDQPSRSCCPIRERDSHGDLLFASYKQRQAPSALSSHPTSGTATPSSAPVVHAATLSGKIIPVTDETAEPTASTSTAAQTPSTSLANGSNDKKSAGNKPWEGVKEDPVDLYWEARDGKIPRPKGQHGCRCGPKSMCDYCMPLEVSLDKPLLLHSQ